MRTLGLSEFLLLRRAIEDQKMRRPTRIAEGKLSLSHTSVRETPKSCPGFAEGGAVHWLSWQGLALGQKDQFLKDRLLTVFWPESKEEVRLVVVI